MEGIRLEQLIFEDYINPDIGHSRDASNIVSLTLKQISRGRFDLADNLCKIKILLKGEERTVILSNKMTIDEFRNLVYSINDKEPSLYFLHKKVEVNKPLLECLKNYQDQFYKFGTEFENEYWYKFYSKSEIEEGMREYYQASWIDYEKQLENGPIIYDELGICGLWAMPYKMLLSFFNEVCKNRYGDNLFILKPVPKCKYIYVDKEIIGDRFKVIKKYDLNSFIDIGKLLKDLINLEKNKYDIQISALIAANISLNEDNTKIKEESDNKQVYLNKEISKYKLLKWLFLLIGIICGFIICKFM